MPTFAFTQSPSSTWTEFSPVDHSEEVRRIQRLLNGDDRDDDAGALLADATQSPMGTLPGT